MSIFAQGAFQQNANETPDQIKRKRALIQAMMPQYGKAKYIGEGLGQLFQGIGSGMQERKLDKAENAGIQGAGDIFSRIMGGAGGSGGGTGGSGSAGMVNSPFVPQAPADPNSPDAIGDDAMAAIGQPSQALEGGWMKYSNQGATRNDPIKPELVSAMSFLPEMGITMDVISGGQEAAGEGGSRTGSTRHDHGNSADVDFYKGGRKLDWNNPDDLPLLTQVVAQAKSRGVTGIGAGDDYMGAGRFHIGFGAPAVWGAGGSSANAPSWLTEAYNGAPTGKGSNITMSAQNEPQQDLTSLYEAMANPFMSQEQRAVLTQMIQQGEQQADPSYQMGLEKQRMELDQMRNPQADPMDAVTLAQARLNYEQDLKGGGAADLPTDIQSLQYRADAAGLVKGTPEYQSFMLNGGGDPATYRALEMQAIQSGLVKGTPEFQNFMATRGAGVAEYAKTEQGNLADTATGGAAAAAIEQGKIEGQATGAAITGLAAAESKASQGLSLIDSIVADPALAQVTGMFQGRLPAYTQAGTDLNVKIKQAKGKAFIEAFESLKGGGAISEREGEAATAAIARLEQTQSTEAYVAALTELKGMMQTGLDRARTKAAPTPGAESPSVNTSSPDFQAFAAEPSAIAAAKKAGVTLEEMWSIKQGLQ